MKHLVESIQILTRFAKETGNRVELIVDLGFVKKGHKDLNPKMLTLFNSLFYMTVIDSVSYLEEYEQVFGIKTEDDEDCQEIFIVNRTAKKTVC